MFRPVALLTAFLIAIPAARAGANDPPNTPTITEPANSGQIVFPSDVHMECAPFADPNPGDEHACTDWEIWTISPSERVWFTACIGGVERLHTHLGDGVFQASHAGRSELFFDTDYLLRVRHRDSSGDPATEWSAYASRPFRTAPQTQTFPLSIDDVVEPPPPTWRTPQGSDLILPAAAVQPSLRLESSAGELLLEFRGQNGGSNQRINPAALSVHTPVRVRVSAGSLAAPLVLPISDLVFTDDEGQPQTIYLPAMSVSAGADRFFWVATSGATYAGAAAQSTPEFGQLERGAPVPWSPRQPGYRIEVVATGFKLPVNIAFVPNPGAAPNSPQFYVTELYGAIKVVTRSGEVRDYATNLLNYDPGGAFPGSGEQGLTGIVVDPATGDVYAGMLYSSNPPSGPAYPKVDRFTSTDGGLTAATRTTILNMTGETQGQSHQISNLSIGPDGKLYVHMGDGFNASTAQNLSSYRGKILRLNLSGSAPTDNPFYNGAPINSRDYVFAYGLRNPFGGAWRAADGLHYEVENGPSVDRFAKVVAGRNFLWDGSDASMANFAIYNWSPATGPVNLAFVQPQTFGGSQFPPDKQGHAFVSESGPTWATGPVGNGKRISEFVLDAGGNLVSGPTPLIEYVGAGKASCVGLAAGPDGLYFTDLYKDQDYASPVDRGANVLRVRFVGAADFTADVTSGPAPLAVRFTDSSTVVSPSAWLWDFGDGATSTQQNPQHVYSQDGAYDVQLSVTGANGLITTRRSAFIRVGAIPRIALVGGSEPPSGSDQAVADHLSAAGYEVTVYDDEPGNRPSAAALAASSDLVIVSSTVSSGNIAGEFRTVGVPLIFWEQALLRTDREALADGGAVLGGASFVDVVDNSHPITEHVPAGPLTVFAPPANMSVGGGTIAGNARVLATALGQPGAPAILTAEAGAVLLGGYVAPARRVFLMFEDASFLSATHDAEHLLEHAVCWARGAAAPTIATPPDSQVAIRGAALTLTVEAGGSGPRRYQWRKDGAPISGATQPLYTNPSVTEADAGVYDVLVSNPCGATASSGATVAVRTRGDANCDGAIDFFDIDAFLLALFDAPAYAAAYPQCNSGLADLNADLSIDFFDIDPFIECLFTLNCP